MTLEPPLNLRVATLADLPSIVRIYNQSIPEGNATCDVEAVTLEDRISWYHAHDTRYPLWSAEQGGRVVGWASISPYSERAGYRQTVENSVYVGRQYRGNGVGRQLLALTVAESERLGYHAILARVFAHNPASVALHRAFGFEQMAYLKEVARIDGVYRDVVFLVRLFQQPSDPSRAAKSGGNR